MNEFAEDLIDSLEINCDGEVLKYYSGRAMYGKRCVAITAENHRELCETLMRLARDEDLMDYGDDLIPDVDSMGLGLVAYWPLATT